MVDSSYLKPTPAPPQPLPNPPPGEGILKRHRKIWREGEKYLSLL